MAFASKRRLRAVVTSAVLSASVFAAGCGELRVERTGPDASAAVQLAVQERIGVVTPPAYVTRDAEGKALWTQTRTFYERRDHQPAWIAGRTPLPQMDVFFAALGDAAREGLDPDLYGLSQLEALQKAAKADGREKRGFHPAEAGELDVRLTYLYLRYASDLADGVSDLARKDATWQIRPDRFEPVDHLRRAFAENRVAESLRELTPRSPEYAALREALADYRRRAAAGGWEPLPADFRARPEGTGPEIAGLARRLAALGDYDGAFESVMTYGPAIEQAVKRFQRRHSLLDDGIVGPAVVRALNVPVEARIAQIALNLERWRWFPRDPGARHILVNIPAYRLDVWEDGNVALSMRIVAGRRDAQTPIFSEAMTYLVFSPYWNVPPGIARDETLPAIQEDVEFLVRNNMEVLDAPGRPVDPAAIDLEEIDGYRFRQRPGPTNALGLVKFMFPNPFNVYLHDTPADSLFDRVTRSFSHGCVRVEEPRALAEYLLRDQPEWTSRQIDEAMHALEERVVTLTAPVPVYLGYWTVAAEPDGIRFASDVYEIDRRHRAALTERLARLARASAAAHTTAARDVPHQGVGQ